jgi:hypothetical protein
MADWRSDDRELLARILTAEAGNQGPLGMTAAGNVIMNRANTTGYGDGVRGVIMKPGQFSPMNSVTGYARGEQGQNIDALRPTETAYMVADSLLQGTAGDITGGATHFFNPDISNPSWAQGKDFTRIGDHVFGRADAGRGTTSNTGATAMRPTTMTQGQPAPMPQEQQQPGGLRGLLSDPDFYDRLAIGLGGLTMNPNQQLMQMSADRIAGRAQTRQDTAATNRTVEYLRSQGRDDLADAVASGSLSGKDAAATLFNKDATEGVVVDGRLINKRTGEVIYEPTGGPAFDVEKVQSARKEFTGLPQVKAFADQTAAYGTLISSVADPSPAGDLSLIFNYMKILDPGSTVREGEFATAQDAGSIDDRTRGLYNRIVNGERLSERQRADFADRATRIYSSAEQQYNSFAEQYGSFAQAAGLPVEQVIPDYSFVGNRYQTPLIYQLPPTPIGVTQQDWTDAWNNMTDAQRQTFLNTPTTP